MPLWVDKSVWKLFLESDYEFDNRDFHKSINETPNDSEKNLHAAIEKTKTGGELNTCSPRSKSLSLNIE
jgi:hypothetical protein